MKQAKYKTIDLKEPEIVERLKSGVAIRFVPRNISGIKACRSWDDEGEQCDLFCGRERMSKENGLLICDMWKRKVVSFKNDGPICHVRLRGA